MEEGTGRSSEVGGAAAGAAAGATASGGDETASEAPYWVARVKLSSSEKAVMVTSLNESSGWDAWCGTRGAFRTLTSEFMEPLLRALPGGQGADAPRQVARRLIVKMVKCRIGNDPMLKYATRRATWKEKEAKFLDKRLLNEHVLDKHLLNAAERTSSTTDPWSQLAEWKLTTTERLDKLEVAVGTMGTAGAAAQEEITSLRSAVVQLQERSAIAETRLAKLEKLVAERAQGAASGPSASKQEREQPKRKEPVQGEHVAAAKKQKRFVYGNTAHCRLPRSRSSARVHPASSTTAM